MPTNKKYVQRSATITLPNGAKKRLKTNGNTEREADIKLAQLIALYNAGLVLPTAKTTFAAYARQYIQTFQVPCLAPRTVEKNRRFLDKHILPYIGQIELGSLTASSIQQCLNLLQNKYARDSIKKIFQLIFKILEHAKTDRLIQYNPAQGVSLPTGKEAASRRALTEEERTLFLDVCSRLPADISAKFLVSYFCGLRPAEVRALRMQNWDQTTQEFNITNSINPANQLIEPKSKAGYRTVPIPDRLNKYLLALSPPASPTHFIFGNADRPCTNQRYERAWHRIIREMNIAAGAQMYRNAIITPVIDNDLSPYYLRHTYCTILAEEGIPLKTAQYLMGHSSVELTAKIYTHVTPKLYAAALPTLKGL